MSERAPLVGSSAPNLVSRVDEDWAVRSVPPPSTKSGSVVVNAASRLFTGAPINAVAHGDRRRRIQRLARNREETFNHAFDPTVNLEMPASAAGASRSPGTSSDRPAIAKPAVVRAMSARRGRTERPTQPRFTFQVPDSGRSRCSNCGGSEILRRAMRAMAFLFSLILLAVPVVGHLLLICYDTNLIFWIWFGASCRCCCGRDDGRRKIWAGSAVLVHEVLLVIAGPAAAFVYHVGTVHRSAIPQVATFEIYAPIVAYFVMVVYVSVLRAVHAKARAEDTAEGASINNGGGNDDGSGAVGSPRYESAENAGDDNGSFDLHVTWVNGMGAVDQNESDRRFQTKVNKLAADTGLTPDRLARCEWTAVDAEAALIGAGQKSVRVIVFFTRVVLGAVVLLVASAGFLFRCFPPAPDGALPDQAVDAAMAASVSYVPDQPTGLNPLGHLVASLSAMVMLIAGGMLMSGTAAVVNVDLIRWATNRHLNDMGDPETQRGLSVDDLETGKHGVICVDNKETYAFYMFCERFVMDRFMLSPYVRGVRGSLDAIMLIVLAGAFALLTIAYVGKNSIEVAECRFIGLQMLLPPATHFFLLCHVRLGIHNTRVRHKAILAAISRRFFDAVGQCSDQEIVLRCLRNLGKFARKAHEKFATDQEKVLGFSITTSFRGLWGGALVAALAAIINVIVAD